MGVSPSSPFWRCNTRLLQEPKTQSTISQLLKYFFLSNETSVSEQHVLWNAHKAVMRGIFTQLGAREKKRYTSTLHMLISEIRTVESQNKCFPTKTLTNTLSKQKYNLHLRRLKLNHYANANRAGKYLARWLKVACTKTKIAHLIHPTQDFMITNPQDIVNQLLRCIM